MSTNFEFQENLKFCTPHSIQNVKCQLETESSARYINFCFVMFEFQIIATQESLHHPKGSSSSADRFLVLQRFNEERFPHLWLETPVQQHGLEKWLFLAFSVSSCWKVTVEKAENILWASRTHCNGFRCILVEISGIKIKFRMQCTRTTTIHSFTSVSVAWQRPR